MEQRDYWEKHGRAFAGLYSQDTWFNRVFRKALFVRARLAVEEVARTPGASVLDVGCGAGQNMVLMLKEASAAMVTGVDIAQDMLDQAARLIGEHGLSERADLVRADFSQWDSAGKMFDYSVALGVFDYLADPVGVLRKMRYVTRKAVVVSLPGFAPVRMLLRKVRYAARGCAVHMYWRREIDELFRQAGFASWRVVRCTGAGWEGIGQVEGGSGGARP